MADLPTEAGQGESGRATLADDERTLADYAQALVAAVDAELDGWVRRSIAQRAPTDAAAAEIERVTATATAATRAHVVPRVQVLLAADIAEQRTGPLDLLRSSVHFATEALHELGATRVERGEFEQRAFPDDHFDLSPASFADVAPALHEPGLLWGAAKAHVHLRRRREAEIGTGAGADPTASPTGGESAGTAAVVVALAPDLMDASKVKSAVPGVTMVRTAAALADITEADAVLIDLGRAGSLDAIATLAVADGVGRIVAFGSHVDEALLAEATKRGADEVLARSVFFSRLAKGALLS